jgi:uncharacterized membrane protein YeaQ/YmgE (transglycosylase-associated protein family)
MKSHRLIWLLLWAAPLVAQQGAGTVPDTIPVKSRGTNVAAVIGGVAGSGIGLWVGIEAGEWSSDHLGFDCCGDDPGLLAQMIGGLVGSVAGTMLGASTGSAVLDPGLPRPSFEARLRDAMFGTLAGVVAALAVTEMTEGDVGPWVTFSLVQGLYAGLSNGRW